MREGTTVDPSCLFLCPASVSRSGPGAAATPESAGRRGATAALGKQAHAADAPGIAFQVLLHTRACRRGQPWPATPAAWVSG